MKKLTSATCSTQKTKPKVCRIHVNQFALRKNIKEETDNPVITVKHGDNNTYGHEVEILDKAGNVVARVIQPLDRKLSCGARVWVETEAHVRVVRRKPFKPGAVDLNG